MVNLEEAAGAALAPGDRLLDLYQRQWATSYAMELLGGMMQEASVTDRARALALEHRVRGDIDGLPEQQLAVIGGSLLSSFLDYDSVERVYSQVGDERARVETELLGLCKEITRERIDVRALDGESGSIRWAIQPSDENSRTRNLTGCAGSILSTRPETFVRQGRLELTPLDFPRTIVGGAYIIEPVGPNGKAQVALNVEVED